jgi:hypothetical protein
VSERAGPTRRGLLVELFWTRTGLLLLLLVLTSGALLTAAGQAQPGTLKNLLAAVGTGALVSALLTSAQTLLTATTSRQVLVDALVAESQSAMRELTEEYRALNREFFPTHVWEPSAQPDPVFNRLMMEDLNNTRQYFFRGFSARYAAARLLLANSVDRELRVVIADPRDRISINGRARYLLRQPGIQANYQSLQSRLYDDLCVGLVGLYVARDRCSRIDVTVMSNPPVDRFEVFDESIWVTLYSNPVGACMPYPRTLRFLRSSFIYNMERSEFLRISNSRTELHIHIDPATDLDEFLALFEKITGRRLSNKRYDALEEQFHAFRVQFAASAQLGG